MPSRRDGKVYKRYLSSACQVPRNTLWRWKRRALKVSGGPLRHPVRLPQVPVSLDDMSKAHEDVPPSEDLSSNSSENDDYQDEEMFDLRDRVDDTSSEQPDDENLFQPLYESCKLTTAQCILYILTFFKTHSISKEALKGLISLILLIIPEKNNLPSSIYRLTKLICKLTKEFSFRQHSYCSSCNYYFGVIDFGLGLSRNEMQCTACQTINASPGIFIEYPLHQVFKTLIEDRHLFDYVPDEFVGPNDCTVDALNSVKIRKQKEQFGLSKLDLRIMWNTDGVPIFKSSRTQLWPLQVIILNLPHKYRNHFLTVCGLWIGSTKPHMNTFLRPFCESLEELCKSPIIWSDRKTGKVNETRVFSNIAVLDAPARALALNMNQYNGAYGCPYCKTKGEVVEKGRGKSRVYVETDVEERSHAEIMQHAVMASSNDTPVCGIKGPSIISTVPYVNLSEDFSPDYMHFLLLGIVRQFLFLWTDSSNHKEDWYIGKKIKILDRLIEDIKPPDYIKRLPRSLSTIKFWKASEFRSWLLYYSLPVLKDVLKPKYFQHWMLLVFSSYTLLQEEIKFVEIDLCDILLKMFVSGTEKLYSKEHCSFNIHQLLHVSTFVKNWGPLWVSSAFGFESNNGAILRMIHGSQNVRSQLINSLRFLNGMLILSQLCEEKSNPTSEAKRKVSGRKTLKEVKEICGTIVQNTINDHVNNQNYEIYSSVVVEDKAFSSRINTRQVRYNNFYVNVNMPNLQFGTVECFLVKNESDVLFVVKRLNEVPSLSFQNNATSVKLSHIVKVENSNSIFFVSPEKIEDKVLFVNGYVCIRPNNIEVCF